MAIRRRRFSLTPPRLVTFAVSLVLAVLAVASLRVHLPAGQGFVAQHRFWILVAAYGLLALGVALPGL